MVSRTDLSVRVRAVLDNHQRRGRTSRSCATAIAVVMALAIVTIGPLTAAARDAHDVGPSLAPPHASVETSRGEQNAISPVPAVRRPAPRALSAGRTAAADPSVAARAQTAAQVPCAIVGTVTDNTGTPLSDVRVEIQNTNTPEDPLVVSTDAAGAFAASDLRPGTYTLVLTLAGYTTFKREGLRVPDGFTATVKAILKENSY
jgi:hypothetical protein